MNIASLEASLEFTKFINDITVSGGMTADIMNMLKRVTGSSSVNEQLIFLLKVIVVLNENMNNEGKNKLLLQKVNELEKVISTYNQHYVQRAKTKAGVKIAAKPLELREKAKRLRKEGKTQVEIANTCGVSRSTIVRWLKEE